MKSRHPLLSLCLGLAAFLTLAGCTRQSTVPRQQLDVDFFLSELTNLSTFAETPLGTSHMVSSYDRTEGNQDWDKMTAPDKDGLYTVVNLQGPGCVKRLWKTFGADAWFFFFDGESTPRVTAPKDELFGQHAPFLPPLADYVSGGMYSYVPIPFEKSLRIAVSLPKGIPDKRAFYQVNYETYDKSIRVESLPKTLAVDAIERVAQARKVWADLPSAAGRAVESCGKTNSQDLAPGASVTWMEHGGAGVLRTFWIGWNDSAETSAQARAKRLRELILRMYWDGAAEPSVEVPLGDFFCNGLTRRRFASLPLAVLDNAMVCRFPMPFGKGARAELVNDGTTPVTVAWGCDVQAMDAGTQSDVNYFHARWNSSTASGQPYRVLRTEGQGHYVGCYLTAIGTDGTWNILESDESMCLNGEATPSMHGTGLEDYFNGAWYYDGLFDLPLHGLLEKAAMRTAQYRFHLADPVGFRDGFLMNWEFGHANASRGYLSSVAYWYQSGPHPAGTKMPPAGQRFPPQDALEPASMVAGLFELEHVGLHREAAERCAQLAEKYAAEPFAPLLRLRAAANREFVGGFGAVRETYETLAREAPESDAARQAQALLWYHESPSNGLLAAHANMRVKFYLDGKAAGEGANPSALTPYVAPVFVGPGAHEIAAEVTPICPSPWVSFALRTHATNLLSDASWECARTRPLDWPRTDGAGTTWTNVEYARAGLPKMNWWQFMPNGYVRMQGGRHVIEPAWSGWEKQPYTTTYLRKRFVVPAPAVAEGTGKTADPRP